MKIASNCSYCKISLNKENVFKKNKFSLKIKKSCNKCNSKYVKKTKQTSLTKWLIKKPKHIASNCSYYKIPLNKDNINKNNLVNLKIIKSCNKCNSTYVKKRKNIMINNRQINNHNIISFKDDKNKFISNMKFFNNIYDNIINNNYEDYYIGLLDSIERNSSNFGINCGISKKSFLLLERNKSIYKDHINNGFNTINGDILDFSNIIKTNMKYKEKICLGFYFDFCGTIRLNTIGLFDLLKNLKLVNKSIIGFTFCKRDRESNNYEDEKFKFFIELLEIMKKISFNIKEISDRSYKNMNTLIFELEKI